MRLSILHETQYSYAEPASRAIHTLRLTPRGHDGQYVSSWRIEVDHDCRLEASTDAFGNAVHSFTVEGELERLTITALGVVETEDRAGVVAGQVERFPAGLYLRETELTKPTPAIRELAEAARGDGSGLSSLHALMKHLNDAMRFDVDATDVRTPAGEAFAAGHGVCQDFAHVFISAARCLDFPCRYVSGYLYKKGGEAEQAAGHGWAEARIEGLGWVGFDATNDLCPTDAYVRVAAGLDYLGAAPVRGTRYGGTDEKLAVRIVVRQSG